MQNALAMIAYQLGRLSCEARAFTNRSRVVVRLTTTNGTDVCMNSMTSLRANETGLITPRMLCGVLFEKGTLGTAPTA
jgi:hypothetical protein